MKSRRKYPSKIALGRYVMHDAVMSLFLLRKGDGSEVLREWHSQGFIKINILCDESWGVTMSNALHELMELSMMQTKCGYMPNNTMLDTGCGADRHFFMDHQQFSEVTCHVADVLIHLIPKLNGAWQLMQKGGGK